MDNEESIEYKAATVIMLVCTLLWIVGMFFTAWLFNISHWSSIPVLIVSIICFAFSAIASKDRRRMRGEEND